MTAAAVAQLARDIRATSSAALADELQDELRFLAEHVLSRGAHTTEAMISHARRTLAEAQATYGAAGRLSKSRPKKGVRVTFQTPPPPSAAAAVEDAAEDPADDPTFDPLRGGYAKPASFPFSPAPSASAPAPSAPPPLTLPHAPTTSVAVTRTENKKRPDSPLITDDDDDDDNMPLDEVERLIRAGDDDGAAYDDDGAARHDDDHDPAPFPDALPPSSSSGDDDSVSALTSAIHSDPDAVLHAFLDDDGDSPLPPPPAFSPPRWWYAYRVAAVAA
jgi:hypothetical protein